MNHDEETRNVQYYNEDEIQSNDFVKSVSSNFDLDIFVNHWIRSSKIRIDYLRRNKNVSMASIYEAIKRPDGYILVRF